MKQDASLLDCSSVALLGSSRPPKTKIRPLPLERLHKEKYTHCLIASRKFSRKAVSEMIQIESILGRRMLRSAGSPRNDQREVFTPKPSVFICYAREYGEEFATNLRKRLNQQEALDELCKLYWYPLYAFIRSRGYSEHDAKDLTQGFFLDLLNHKAFTRVDRRKG